MFRLECTGRNYTLQSDLMSRTAEWILRYAVCESDFSPPVRQRSGAETAVAIKPVEFSDADIARLDIRAAKARRDFSQTEPSMKLSHLLRSLGDHLDQNSARAFHIFWLPDTVLLDYRRPDGLTDRRRFTLEKLRELNSSACRRRLLTMRGS
jgi:hypothetical protein